MTSQDFEKYKVTRYLRNASDISLRQRITDIGTNLWSTDRNGNVTQIRYQTHRIGLLRLLSDVIFEQHLRNPAHLLEFNEAVFRQEITSSYSPPSLNKEIDFEPSCFSKFGKKEHIINSFENGIFRIAPASSYNDPSLNTAQQDDELINQVQTPNEQLKFKFHGINKQGQNTELNVKPAELIRYMQVPDYYVWCCGMSYDARLFTEFKADAALIIKDVDAFKERLSNAVREKLPAAKCIFREVEYYDPYTTEHSQLTPCFSKHLRYLYQNEYRFSWTLDHPGDLNPFFVEIGSMHDIATTIELR